MHDIVLHELMSPSVVSVDIESSLDDVIALMREHVYSCIVVIENTHPVGIITERDLVRVLADLLVLTQEGAHEGSLYVKDLMSKPVVTIHRNSTLYEALVITQTRSIRHLPVVNDDDHLVGLVTQTDIAQAHFTAVERHREIIEQEIRDRTKEVVSANEELKALALQDGLLNIGNRRAMEVDIHVSHANFERYGRAYSCALIDVDHFKIYNDCNGHQAGDEVLIKVADCIKKSLRCSDRLYRYGGEEFLALMPETNLFEAVQAIHRVLENLDRLQLPHNKSPLGVVTVSAGISFAEQKQTWEEVVEEADSYLYLAKDMGRNQACWNVESQTSMPPTAHLSSQNHSATKDPSHTKENRLF